MLASCWVYRVQALDAPSREMRPPGLWVEQTCAQRADSIAVIGTKYGPFLLGCLTEGRRSPWADCTALATTPFRSKVQFQAESFRGPKGVLFPQPLCFAVLGRRAGGQEGREGDDSAFQVSDCLSGASGARHLSISPPE